MKQIVIMPGGFHPFHAGHYALYKSALEAFPQADVYVAATNDQSERPFPFSIKEKLAKLAGVKQGRFVQVKSPFQAKEITQNYDPNSDVLIFVRSEKDRNEQPKPGGTKKDGSPAYFQPWTGKDLQPFGKHGYIAYLPTVTFGPGIQSATEIRKAWPTLDDRRKTAMVMSLYPATQKNPKLAQNVVQLLDMGMGGQVTEDISRRGFLKGIGAAATAAATAKAGATPIFWAVPGIANAETDPPLPREVKWAWKYSPIEILTDDDRKLISKIIYLLYLTKNLSPDFKLPGYETVKWNKIYDWAYRLLVEINDSFTNLGVGVAMNNVKKTLEDLQTKDPEKYQEARTYFLSNSPIILATGNKLLRKVSKKEQEADEIKAKELTQRMQRNNAGPSSTYANQISKRVKPNIVFTGDIDGNPRTEVEIRSASDGTIINRLITQSSGNAEWDKAVLRAIDKTGSLPRDLDGNVPPVLVMSFRPNDLDDQEQKRRENLQRMQRMAGQENPMQQEGVAEGPSNAWAVTGTWTQRKYMREPMTTTTKVIANSPEEAMRKYKSYMWNEYERKVIDMKVKPYTGQGTTAVPIGEQGVAEAEDVFMQDPESDKILRYAQQHYPNAQGKQQAFMKFVQRALMHSKEEDETQDEKLEKLEQMVNKLADQLNKVNESTDYIEEK